MAVIAKRIEKIAGDEKIEGAVIGKHIEDFAGMPFNAAPIGKLISWDEAKVFLSYNYTSDLGVIQSHPVFAWTATKVITSCGCNAATDFFWLPRHPTDSEPTFGGAMD